MNDVNIHQRVMTNTAVRPHCIHRVSYFRPSSPQRMPKLLYRMFLHNLSRQPQGGILCLSLFLDLEQVIHVVRFWHGFGIKIWQNSR